MSQFEQQKADVLSVRLHKSNLIYLIIFCVFQMENRVWIELHLGDVKIWWIV